MFSQNQRVHPAELSTPEERVPASLRLAAPSQNLAAEQLPERPKNSPAAAVTDRPDRYRPIGLGEMVMLKTTAVLGQVATSAISGAAFISGLAHLMNVDSKWCLGILAGTAVLTLGVQLLGSFIKNKIEMPTEAELVRSHARVKDAVDRVGPELGCLQVEVLPYPKPLGFAVCTRILHTPTLLYDPRLEPQLDKNQLDAVVGHELAHCGRSWTSLQIVNGALKQMAQPAAFWTTAHAVFTQLSPTGLLGTSLAVLGAAVAGQIACFALTSLASIPLSLATRANEVLTDRRALLVTKNQAAFESGLQLLVQQIKSSEEKPRSPLQKFLYKLYMPLDDHPTLDARCAYLRGKLDTAPQEVGNAAVH